MSAAPIRVDRVLGEGLFREIGKPLVAEFSPDGGLVVIGGDLGPLSWHGHEPSTQRQPSGLWRYREPLGRYALAAYEANGDPVPVHFAHVQWPVRSVAFHPVRPVVAVGTGGPDVPDAWKGELLLLDLESGRVTSVLAALRDVRRVAWRDENTLDLVLEATWDGVLKSAYCLATSIFLGASWDQSTLGKMALGAETQVPRVEPPDSARAVDVVEGLCQERGLAWNLRRGVWAVRVLPDGRILSASEGIALECWEPGAEATAWSVLVEGFGYQVHVPPHRRTARVLTQVPHWLPERRTLRNDPSVVLEISVDDGTEVNSWTIGSQAVMVSRSDGWWSTRAAGFPTGGERVEVRSPTGDLSAIGDLESWDVTSHPFEIRYAPDLLYVHGERPWYNQWVVAGCPPGGAVRRLFPVDWDCRTSPEIAGSLPASVRLACSGPVCGGVGVYLSGLTRPVLVYAGTFGGWPREEPDPEGFVICRDYSSGEPLWAFTTNAQATDLDTDGEYIYVTYDSGELVVLHSADGTLCARHEVRVDGRMVIPLSLAAVDPGRVVIGTLDGMVLTCSISGARTTRP